MLTLLIGRAGSGKSTQILNKIRESGAKRKQILLVPEQASYEAERRICERNGNAVGQYAEVLSFTRLENRVLSRAGGLAEPTLDAGGRLLVMYAALNAVRAHLSVYAMPSRKPEFLTGLLNTVDEFKSYCISAVALGEIAEQTEGVVGDKLRDLSLIYGAYEAMTAQGKLDPRDRLTRLAEKLKTSAFLADKDIYLDGFTDFTPQQGMVIRAFLKKASTVTVSLTCDHLEEDENGMGIFSPARRTGAYLLRLAKQCGVPAAVEVYAPAHGFRAQALTELEQCLFSEVQMPIEDPSACVKLYSAPSARDEVVWTAEQILDLVKTHGMRYREIAVVARSFECYQDWVESVFAQYRIPVFQSIMTDILEKPIFTLITAALDTVTGNYTYEDMFRYLKTGLTSLSSEDCDQLENYVLTWKIRGSQWTAAKDWTMHPDGYHRKTEEADRLLLEHLNTLRRKIIEPLEKLRKNGCETIREQVISLYTFLEEIGVPEKLTERTEQWMARGEPELAQEYDQLWTIFCGGLEQCVALLGDMPADLDEFSRLLRLLLSQYDVGSIPASLDRVTAGDAPRLSNRHVKALFLLGADDSAIPLVAPAAGLLTDRDRDLLSEFGLEVAPRAEEKVYREMTIAYMTVAQPTERFFLTWPKMGENEKRPSFLVDRIRTLFPSAEDRARETHYHEKELLLSLAQSTEGQVFLQTVPEYAAFVDRFQRAAEWERGQLSRTVAEKLYGKKVPMSASRMDKYKSCHFAYYMQYGLQAKARKSAGFYAPEYGTFIHFVLEHVLREAKARGGVKQQSKAELRTLARQAVQRYIKEELGGLEQQTARFRYLFRRLERAVLLVVENVTEELSTSEFQPIAFELGFGSGKALPPVELVEDGVTISISGFVDRVDGWVKDGRLYLRVVDYKTGRKSFDFTEIWNGLGLQMLLYLFTLQEEGEAVFGQPIEPAGVLYLPAREAIISGSRSMSEETRRALMDKDLVRKGLLLEDASVLEAMEPTEGGVRFLPIRVSAKTGKITGESLVSAQKLGRLKKHIERTLSDICKELASGTITADPFWRSSTNNACLYCDYAQACHFEEGQGGDQRRWIPSVRNSAFWEYLEGQEGQDGVSKN